jgi:hypothetical protein
MKKMPIRHGEDIAYEVQLAQEGRALEERHAFGDFSFLEYMP